MSEKLNSAATVVAGNSAASKPVSTSAVGGAEKIAPAPVGQPVFPASKPPVLFGGHRGGGKKRADGLIAGSPAAREADLKKDRDRKAAKKLETKLADLPPPLPSLAAPAGGATLAPAGAGPVDLAPELSVAPGAAVVPAPLFVAWTLKMLERPIRALTKIADRIRVSKLMDRVRKLGFDKETEKEAEQRIAYKQTQVEDFNAALANCAVIEFNRRAIGGAQYSHFLELAMTGGELLNCHLDTVDWLEKKILEKAEREKMPGKA